MYTGRHCPVTAGQKGGGGGGWQMDIRDPLWAQANFPPPLCIPLQYHKVVSLMAPQDAIPCSLMKSVSMIRWNCVFCRWLLRHTGCKLVPDSGSTLHFTFVSRLKGAFGTTDEYFVLLRLCACVSQRVTHVTPYGGGHHVWTKVPAISISSYKKVEGREVTSQ